MKDDEDARESDYHIYIEISDSNYAIVNFNRDSDEILVTSHLYILGEDSHGQIITENHYEIYFEK